MADRITGSMSEYVHAVVSEGVENVRVAGVTAVHY
jgi:hypothetical protein